MYVLNHRCTLYGSTLKLKAKVKKQTYFKFEIICLWKIKKL